MTDTADRNESSSAVTALSSVAGTVAIVGLCHLLGMQHTIRESGYRFTHYFTECAASPAMVALVLWGGVMGWVFRRRLHVALGILLPLPVALIIELAQDPTSHNLFPFEILLFWCPAFLLFFGAAWAGMWIRARNTSVQ